MARNDAAATAELERWLAALERRIASLEETTGLHCGSLTSQAGHISALETRLDEALAALRAPIPAQIEAGQAVLRRLKEAIHGE